jgi:DNA-binding Xre family transcriptional regulator
MPTKIDIESARLRWQAIYNRTLSDEELVEIARIPMAALHRMRSGTMYPQDRFKLLALCKAIECDPYEVIISE